MTHKLPQSFIDLALDRGLIVNFKGAVTEFCAELNSWHSREKEIAAQPPLLPKPQWHEFERSEDPAAAWGEANKNWCALARGHKAPYPRPSAHPDIEASVRYNSDAGQFVEDYDIFDDGPTPEQVLAAKKAALIEQVRAAEMKAIGAATLPAGKQRLATFMMRVIAETDQKFMDKLIKDVAPADLAAANVERLIEQNRTEDQKAFLAEQAAREAKLARIDETAAIAMSSIEDLTADNVDSFEIPSFEH